MVLGLCERFHCLPSQLDEESSEIIRMVTIYSMGTKQQQNGPDYEPDEYEEE